MANTRTRKINQNVELNTTYDFVANDGTFSGIVTGNSFVGPLTGNVTGTVSSLSNHDTGDLDEGTNLYFTTTRARAAFSAGTGVNITSGVISIGQSVSTASDVTFGSVTATTFEGALTGDVTGNADTASALEAAVNIALTGSVTGNVDFDGSGNVSITTTTNHNHDDRYYTETESDGKYLLNTTDTLDGDLTVTGDLNVTGTIDLSNADLNIGAADIVFGTATGGATRGLIWDVSGSYLSKLIGGGADGGKVTLFANMDDAITTGNIFEIKDGSLGSLFLGLSHAGILTAGGGTSTQWNTAYTYSQVGHLPLAGGTITGNLDVDGIIDNTRNNTNAAPPSTSDHAAGTRIKFWDSSDVFFYAIGIENGHIWSNADVGFKWYQRAVEKMSLSNGNLTVTGTLSASGYNKSNWDTAYGWGDHDGLYLPIAGKAADSQLLDGLDSSLFIYGNNSSGTNDNNVNDWNAPTKTGFYSHSNAANKWAAASDWSSILHFKLYNNNNNYASQLGFNTYDNRVFARTNSGGTWTAWDEFITSANIGSQSVSYATSAGSALVADVANTANYSTTSGTASNADYASNSNLLDSLDSSQFLRSDEADVMTGDGAANTYRGVLRINNTGTYKWGGIAFPDDVNAADSAKNNYYFIGRGDLISDRVMSFHIPTGGNYESGIQPKFVFASTGADQLMTIQATTGNVFVKGDLGVGTSTPSTYMSGTKGISIVNATNAALGLSNGTNNWLNYLSADTYRIWNNTKGEVVTIALNGNIGIGTNSPIDGGSAARWVTLNGTSYSGGIAYAVSGNGIAYHYAENNFLISQGTAGVGHKWFANSALKMTMLSSGDLGIGTDSPETKLHVNGGDIFVTDDGGNPRLVLGDSTAGGNWGSIQWDSAGDFIKIGTSLGTSTLVVNENNYVGINTTSPGQRLHVDGNVLFNGGTGASTFNDVNIGGISGWSGNEAHRINFVYGSASSPNIFQTIESHFDGNTSRLRFRNLFNASAPSTDISMTILGNGNVGIGIDTPGFKLHVKGSGNYDGAIAVDNSTTTGGGALMIRQNGVNSGFISVLGSALGTSGRDLTYFAQPGLGHYFYVNDGTMAMRITSGAKIGVGTTNPSGKFDVAHDMYTGAGAGVLQSGAYGNINFKGASSQGGTTTQQGITWQVDSYGGTTNYGVQAQIAVGNNGSVGTFMGFFTSNDYSNPPVERIRIQHNGNVGIGTASPIVKLHVADSNGGRMVLQSVGGSGINWQFNSYTDGKLYIGNYGVGDYMTLTSAGDVGIGTTNPVAGLSTPLTLEDSVYGYVGISLRGTGNYANTWQLYASGDGGSTKFFGLYDRTNSAYRLVATNGGNIGIGTTSPAQKITIESNSSSWTTAPQVGFYDSVVTANARNWAVGAVSTNYGDFNIASSTAQGGAPTTPRLTINKDGIVGIGTTSPASYMSGTLGLSIFSASNAALGLSNGTNNWLNYLSGSTYRIWNNSVAEVVTILLNGNIGIARTNPEYKLDVAAATIRATNNIIIGEDAYSTNGDYVGMKTTFQTGANDYMILSGKADGATYVSAKDGEAVYIRGGGNSSSNQIQVLDGTYILATTGAFRVTGDVVAYYSSDKQLKDNITPIPNALDKVKAIGGYEFDWNDKQDRYEGHDIGVIAQEVEAVLPEIVATREDGYKAVKYEKLVAVLIEAVKDQQKQIDELKAIVNGITK